MSVQAPGLRIAGRAIGRGEALDALAAGELDLALGFFRGVDEGFIAEELRREDYVVVGHRQRHDFGDTIPLRAYLKLPHILVSPAGDLRGVVDDLLDSKGLKRRVIAALPLFLPALAAVQSSNAIATVPRRIANIYAAAFDLITDEPPLPVRSFIISAVRHRRDERNPMHRWLIDKLKEISKAAGPSQHAGKGTRRKH